MERELSDHPSRLPATERATLAILALATALFAIRAFSKPELVRAATLHGALLVGYALVAYLALRHAGRPWAPALRASATIGVVFTLYSSLGESVFAALPWTGDPLLDRVDRTLFLGTSPSLWIASHVTFARLEGASLVYGFFIPSLYVSILLGCIGRPEREREEFLTGFVFLYAASFLGYLFLPSRGPIAFLAGEFASPLSGGFFHRLVIFSTAATGGIHGAFPSLHVGASAYACFFDLKYSFLRGWIYVPIVFLIALATLVVRYHYVTDLLVGAALALLAVKVAPRFVGGGR